MVGKIDVSVFKDVNGRWRTISLFDELSSVDSKLKYPPIFLLRESEDRDGLTSMKRIYMEAMDPTEWKAAQRIFGCWDAWEALWNCPPFMAELEKWRNELQLKLRSLAVDQIIDTGLHGGKSSGTQFAAAKWLAEGQWKRTVSQGDEEDVPKNDGRGRPSKVTIEREAKRQLREISKYHEEASEDLKRIGIIAKAS